jgi:virginiamycin B lyase
LWFTAGAAIGRITTSGVLTSYPLPVRSARSPGGITPGPDGALWFADDRYVGRITVAGTITLYPVPSGGASWIAAGPGGGLWFTGGSDDILGHISLDGTIIRYSLAGRNNFPQGITPGPDGSLWFTEQLSNTIGRFRPRPE